MGAKRNKNKQNKNTTLDVYKGFHKWEKGIKYRVLDQDEIDRLIYNDLPIDEYYDSKKLPSYEWVSGEYNKTYNLNKKAKAKRDKEREDGGNKSM